MRVKWHWGFLAVATTAGALLVGGRGDLAKLLSNADGSSASVVDDRAALFTAAERTQIADYHAALGRTHDIDYRVLAIAHGGDLERAAHDYFEASGVGSFSANGRGLLLVIDTASQRVRLEVSTSLEGVYTDAFTAYVQNRQMAPFFAAGRVADGVAATTELIVGRAQDADTGREFAPPMPATSMGAGASAAATIGTTNDPTAAFKRQTQQVDVVGMDPLQIVETYHERMASRDALAD